MPSDFVTGIEADLFELHQPALVDFQKVQNQLGRNSYSLALVYRDAGKPYPGLRAFPGARDISSDIGAGALWVGEKLRLLGAVQFPANIPSPFTRIFKALIGIGYLISSGLFQ
jgi:hypothetical protein